MEITIVILGLFIWFALAFNGGVGASFVNYAALACGMLLIVAGSWRLLKLQWQTARAICTAAILAYLPMIWQRTQFQFDTDWVGFGFDAFFIALMLLFVFRRPDDKIT